MATGFLFLFWTSDSSWSTIWGSLRFLSFTLAKGGSSSIAQCKGQSTGPRRWRAAVIMAGRCGEGGAGSGLPNFHGESFTSTLAVDAGGCGASGLLDSFQCLRDFSQVGTLVRLSAMELCPNRVSYERNLKTSRKAWKRPRSGLEAQNIRAEAPVSLLLAPEIPGTQTPANSAPSPPPVVPALQMPECPKRCLLHHQHHIPNVVSRSNLRSKPHHNPDNLT